MFAFSKKGLSMSELKLSEYIKSKKWGTVMKLAVAFILSFALLFVGVVAVSSSKIRKPIAVCDRLLLCVFLRLIDSRR